MRFEPGAFVGLAAFFQGRDAGLPFDNVARFQKGREELLERLAPRGEILRAVVEVPFSVSPLCQAPARAAGFLEDFYFDGRVEMAGQNCARQARTDDGDSCHGRGVTISGASAAKGIRI